MEHKKSNHSWDEEEIKKYLEQSAEAEEIPPELETENMRKYIKTQTTGEQQKKHKNITGNIKHWYPAVTAACLCIILLAGVSGITRKAGTDQCGILLKEAPSYALIDSQSAKTVSSNENRGYDGGKKQKDESGI